MATFISFIPFFFLIISSTNATDIDIVTDFGAVGYSKTDVNKVFLAAWAAAYKSSKASIIHVPSKRFFLSPIEFQGPCNNSRITFILEGILVVPDYKEMTSSENWIMFNGVDGLSIIGGGYLDGGRTTLWTCKAAQNNDCPTGNASLAFYSSKDILVQNMRSINAKLFHMVVFSSQNVVILGVRIHALGDNSNTNGIYIQNSNNVRIFKTSIGTGDDCVSIGPNTENVLIRRLECGPGHGIRSDFKEVVMKNVQNPIVIDQNYCPQNKDCLNQNSGIQISGVTFTNIIGTSASQIAMFFNCSSTSPCKGIGMQDIKLTYNDQTAESFCKNVHGTVVGVVSPPSCL
ncbi:hypothetical protein NE237_027212 [Protea cynaroides]|uniref:Polygalacturonase n=1 Tax=Protea cynaroides TaxID=273540 RepID=A0A9Q0GQ25_9MAGN|nr:hypothetical protein NE237_027212 [Protea cynaroides]